MIDKSKFIPGLKLSGIFYQEAVKPILDKDYPNLIYSAALLGSGSEVLGLDTPQSIDHHWGPRVQLLLNEDNYSKYKDAIVLAMSKKLPYKIHDIPTNYGKPDKTGVQLLKEIKRGPINHCVSVVTVKSFFSSILAFNPHNEITVYDWLTFSEQHLLSITAGKVFYDGLDELEKLREKFSYYPRDVWLCLLSAQWMKISQEEAFVGRCGDLGDETGSRIIANRIILFLMKLCFLMERKYAPYSKWFGAVFSKLELARELTPIIKQIQSANTWKERERYLSQAYEVVAKKHNSLNITAPLDTKATSYYGRPYFVIHAEHFAKEIKKAITNKEVKKISEKNIGSVDQFIDSTDVLSHSDLCRKLKVVYK